MSKSTIAEFEGEPEIRQVSLWSDAWNSLCRSPIFIIGAIVGFTFTMMAIVPQLFTTKDPTQCSLANSKKPPSAEAWFGYDVQGCDYFANVVYGARVSMSIGLVATILLALIGILIGSLAGYYGGFFDNMLSRLTDIFYGIPFILGAMLLLTSYFAGNRGVVTVAIALVTFGWMTAMRLVRSTVLSVKDADYIQSARALGAPTWRILSRHILPNALAPLLVYLTITFGGIIAAEATLSYLGIGLQLPAISWGLQISSGQRWLRLAPHLVLFPGLFLSLAVLSFILMGDALRDALDPKTR